MLYAMEVKPTLIKKIQGTQSMDQQLERIWAEVIAGKASGFIIDEDRTLRFHNWVCVLAVEELKRKILDKGHNILHFMYPGGTSYIRT